MTDAAGAILVQIDLDSGRVLTAEPVRSRAEGRRQAMQRNCSPTWRPDPRIVWQVRAFGDVAHNDTARRDVLLAELAALLEGKNR